MGRLRPLSDCTGGGEASRPERAAPQTPLSMAFRFSAACRSVVETYRQVVVVREFIPEFEDDRAVVQNVARDNPVGIDFPDLFYPVQGSDKHLHRGIPRYGRT